MNTERDFKIFIQQLRRSTYGSDVSYAFSGTTAVYNDKQKLYREDGVAYKFRGKSIAALENANPGDIYRVKAREVPDPAYGYRWQVITAEQSESAAVQEIRKFFIHIRERSITPKRGDALVTAYKEKTLDAILEAPSSLDILNIRADIKERIYHAITEHRSFAGLLRFLTSRRLDCRLALQLYVRYKDKALSTFREDPYVLYRDGIAGFRTADGIYLRDGGKTDAPQRCRNVVQAVLHEEEVRNGGMFIPRSELNKKIARLVEDGSPVDYTLSEDDTSKTLSWLEESEQIHIDRSNGREGIYPSPLYHAEVDVAESLKALCLGKKSVACSEEEIDQQLDEYETATGVQLAPGQREAVRRILVEPVSILTGGPGTGKTLIVQVAIDILRKLYPRAVVQCCALTGKAVERMPAGACTIDLLIKRMVNYPYQRKPDIFFVDEASMVDIKRFVKLLAIIPTGARLVLIGDQNQLPSIEAGQVLRDLIESGVIHTIQLREVFRQEANSDILSNAEKINKTAPDQDIHLDEKGEGFLFNKSISSPHRIVNAVLDTYGRLLENGNSPATIQIILWRKHGEVGVQHINNLVQERFNPQDEKDKMTYNGREFRLHDRVIHIKNNYKLEVFNGETGEITEIQHTKERALTVQYPSGTVHYAERDLEELELAYALTVHKYQGSEYSIVIIPIVGKGISRRMLYTAVTRGRQLVLMIGTESALTAGMRDESDDNRASWLAPRLQQLLPPILPEVDQMSLFPSAQN